MIDQDVLAADLAQRLRGAIDQLRPHGITLQAVYDGIADELGRTSAALPDDYQAKRWLARRRWWPAISVKSCWDMPTS